MAVKSATETNTQACFPDAPEAEEAPRTEQPVKDRAAQDQVERLAAKENDAGQSMIGRMIENRIGTELDRMPPGSKITLDLSDEIKGDKLGVPVIGKGKVTVSLERCEDGSFVATSGGAMGFGGAMKLRGSGLEQTLNGDVTTTYRFGSKEEAADKLSALAQSAAIRAAGAAVGPLAGAVAQGLADPGLEARVQKIVDQNCKSVEVGVSLKVGASINAPPAKASIALSPRASVKVDFDAQTVTVDRKAAVEQNAGLSSKVSGAVELTLGSSVLAEKAAASLTLRDTYGYEGGGMGEILGKVTDTPRSREVIAKVTGQANLVEFEAERRFPLSELFSSNGLIDLSAWEFAVKLGKTSTEAGLGLDAEVVKVGLKAKYELPGPSSNLKWKGKLGDIGEKLEQKMAADAAEQGMIEAQRAMAR